MTLFTNYSISLNIPWLAFFFVCSNEHESQVRIYNICENEENSTGLGIHIILGDTVTSFILTKALDAESSATD